METLEVSSGNGVATRPHGAAGRAPPRASDGVVAALRYPGLDHDLGETADLLREMERGTRVEKGAPLVVLEAMKMEHTVTAPRDGRVAEIYFPVDALVSEGAQLDALEEPAA